MPESIATLLVLMTGLVVLGVAWLIYLGTGGKPVRVTFEGFGIKVDIARPGVNGSDVGDVKNE